MNKSAAIKPGAPMSNAAATVAADSRFSKRMKVIVGVCAAILIMGGMIIAAMPEPGSARTTTAASRPAATTGSGGVLRARESLFNFGSISMAAGKVSHVYRFRNEGERPIVLEKMYTSCMCTTAALIKSSGRKFAPVGMPGHAPIPALKETLQPKEEAMVEVVFDPAAHGPAGVGPIERVVTIENSTGRPFELAFSANVTP